MPIPAWTTSHMISPICTSTLMLSLTWVLSCKPLILCHFEVCLEQVQKVSILTFTFCSSRFDRARSKILFCESATILQVLHLLWPPRILSVDSWRFNSCSCVSAASSATLKQIWSRFRRCQASHLPIVQVIWLSQEYILFLMCNHLWILRLLGPP